MPLTKEQLEMRRTGITATDAVVLAGLSPFADASAHRVWAEKVGVPIEALTGDRLELGHELEPIILRRLAKKRALMLVPGETVRSRLYAHHLATPDAIHKPNGEPRAVAEAKAVGIRYAHEWGDEGEEIPDHVLGQVTWQMHVLGLEQGYVGALIGTEVRTYPVAIDHDLVAALVETADRFWTDHVVPKKPPPIDGTPGATQMLRALFPRNRGPMLKAGPAIEAAARSYFHLKHELERDEQRLESAKQELMAACGEAEGITGDGWRLKYAWREGREVAPKPYTLPGGRHFDLRTTSGGRR